MMEDLYKYLGDGDDDNTSGDDEGDDWDAGDNDGSD